MDRNCLRRGRVLVKLLRRLGCARSGGRGAEKGGDPCGQYISNKEDGRAATRANTSHIKDGRPQGSHPHVHILSRPYDRTKRPARASSYRRGERGEERRRGASWSPVRI